MKKFIPFAVVALAVALGFLFTAQPKTPPDVPKADEQQVELVQAQLMIEDSVFDVEVPAGSSALNLMRAVDETSDDFTFTGSNSEFGFFVESINGIENDNDTATYWTYEVNGELAQVGVSDYIVQNEDKINWTYEAISF